MYRETKKSGNFFDAKITKRSHAFQVYTTSYDVEILNYNDSELQIKGTKSEIKNKIIDLLSELRGFKFVKTLVLEFKKIGSDDKTKYDTFYLNSKTKTIINESYTDDIFESIYNTYMSNILRSYTY